MKLALASWLALTLVAPAMSAETGAAHGANELPAHVVADPSAETVTHANALASERFWPYQVKLSQGWSAPSGPHLAPGTTGVLIRVEPAGNLRVDFGRDGLHTLPLGFTDFLARANNVRLGADTKVAPNLTYAIAPRLIDAQSELPRRLPFEQSFETTGYLAVFARTEGPSLEALAQSLAPVIAPHPHVRLVLFPDGNVPDPELHARLHGAGWAGAFLMDHLAEAYARTLVDDEEIAVALFSAEGRTLWTSGRTDDAGGLGAALARELGAPRP
jgi:hypothetical protein